MKSSDHQILEIDCGNSRGKWRVVDAGKIPNDKTGCRYSGTFDYDHDLDSLLSLLPLNASQLLGCRVVSVAPALINVELQKTWEAWSSAPIRFAKVERECGGVTCGYEDLSQLGVDRWSAIVSASKIVNGACVVIDAGTAITADILDAEKKHHGGYILPGMELMLDSLREKTAIPDNRVPSAEALLSTGLASNTASAIAAGVARAVSAFCVSLLDASDHEAEIVVTGGNAIQVAHFFEGHVSVFPELVLDGLSVLVPMEKGFA